MDSFSPSLLYTLIHSFADTDILSDTYTLILIAYSTSVDAESHVSNAIPGLMC